MTRPFPAKAVLVFAKPPRPGHVKTRLRSVLTAQQAAELHLACVQDTARMVASAGGYRKWLLVAGRFAGAQQLARLAQLSSRWCLGVQVGRDLGARLEFAFGSHFTAGVRKVVIVGTDTPWMGAERILRCHGFAPLGGYPGNKSIASFCPPPCRNIS